MLWTFLFVYVYLNYIHRLGLHNIPALTIIRKCEFFFCTLAKQNIAQKVYLDILCFVKRLEKRVRITFMLPSFFLPGQMSASGDH